jgi:hypothetical protein
MSGGSISQRKLAANRANTQLSTGPRTPDGKARSSRNALKHGLLSGQILLSHENADELDALRENLCADLRPVGALEELLVERIVSSAWSLRRAVRAERALIMWNEQVRMQSEPEYYGNGRTRKSGQPDYGREFEMLTDHRLESIQRYETTKERQMYRALHEFQRLQAARQNVIALPPVAVDVDVRGDGFLAE